MQNENEKQKVFEWKEGVSFGIEYNSLTELIIYYDGKEVGRAKMNVGKYTIYVERIDIKPEYQNQKFGTNLLEQVNFFIREKNADGYLYNTIIGKKENLFSEHGWVPAENAGKMRLE